MGLKKERADEKERMKRAEKADEKERMKREKRAKIMGGERNVGLIKIYIYFFLQLCYSTILKIELYCSTIVKFFTISMFSIL